MKKLFRYFEKQKNANALFIKQRSSVKYTNEKVDG